VHYDKAVSLGPLFSILTDAISRDREWLNTTLESCLKSDAFTARLLEMYDFSLPPSLSLSFSLFSSPRDHIM
jgi:hypothetical protein